MLAQLRRPLLHIPLLRTIQHLRQRYHQHLQTIKIQLGQVLPYIPHHLHQRKHRILRYRRILLKHYMTQRLYRRIKATMCHKHLYYPLNLRLYQLLLTY
jgi:hypothetical protein